MMKKIDGQSPEAKSPDLVAENLAALRALFPELITEGPDGVAVNLDVLKSLVGDRTVTDAEEKYGLNWHGKRRARQLALTPSVGTLRPCPEESVGWENTQNVMIEGDNLEVLKLLQKSYAGKVKLIYIDPPYNTGKDFVYPDNFQDNIKNYLELTGQVEGGRKTSSHTEASGRFHTDWLNMMYSRLKLARNLLREDGVLFVSLDDSEVSNCKQLLCEIYGEENFLANVIWQKKYTRTNDAKFFSENHDHILVFTKNQEHFTLFRLNRTGQQDHAYTNPDKDPKGPWKLTPLQAKSGSDATFEHVFPNGVKWSPPSGRYSAYGHDRLNELYQLGALYFGQDGKGVPSRKTYLCEVSGLVPETIWPHGEVGQNHEANNEMKSFFENLQPFSNPKPSRLIQRILQISSATEDGDIILDFFAGSGTTGHAVMSQNLADNGKRHYLLVQLPEPLDPENKDQKVAADFCDKLGKPRNIAELTKERLRRAGKKIRSENPQFAGDFGFRVFKLASSNIRAWEPDRDKLADSLFDSIDHLKADRTEQDILFELLLKLGLDLCVPIETRQVAGTTKQAHEIHAIGGGTLLVCLAPATPQADVELLALGIVAWHRELNPAGETTVVFRDSAFADDVAKTNLTAILHQHGLQNVRSL